LFTALGVFLTALLTSAQGALAPVVGLAGLLIGGAVWGTGNPQMGKTIIIGALLGVSVMLLSSVIVAGLVAIPH
jgi:hypothetical protein